MNIKNEQFLILSAESTHLIMQLEKKLLEKEIPCRVIPLPTEISANCGLAVRVELENKDKALETVKNEEIKVKVSLVEKTGFKKNIQELQI